MPGYPGRLLNNYGQHVRQNVLDRAGQALQGPFSDFMGQGGQVLYLLHATLYGAWNSISR